MVKIAQKPGNLHDLDNAANAYAAILTEYLPNWLELKAYNRAKKYEDDAGAKGKELLPKYNEGQAKLIIAQENFEVAAKAAIDEESVKRIAEYKSKGLLLELHTAQALEKAEQMLAIFDELDDFKNQAKIDQANMLLAELDAELEAMDKEIKERRSKLNSPWGDVYSSLIDFTGEYRAARKDPKRYDDMVRKYNRAVGYYNQ